MVYIESAEAKKELGRIDDILNEKHILIGGLAVKYFYPARESKDIDLVCSDAVRNTIIRELYPTNEWDIFDENMDEYRPDYHIKNKKNGLIISFGPKIKEREPYADIDWDLLVKEYSIAFENKRVKYKKIYIPSAGALAFTKLISFVNRETHKDIQDLQDFVDLTNHKSCALDDLFNLIDRVADKSKLRENFWKKIASKKECASIIAKGNIFKLADFFTESKPSPQSNGFADATNKVNILEDNPIIFFSQKKRPLEADISDNLKNAEEFFFMARTGVNFLGSHKSAVCHAIDNGCVCKFLIVNQHSPAIDYGQLRPIVDRKNVPVSYQWLQEIKEYDKGRNRVEIRVLNNFPPFGIEYFKKKDGKKIINVRPYFLTNYEPEKRPLLMVKEHSEWQNIFYSEFEQLWEKAQIWGNTRGWGKPKRIVLDGSPGGGKTTLLSGTSQRDIYNREFKGINKSGYTVFGNLINASIEDMRRKSANKSIQPPDDWKLFFECATDRAIKYYEAAKPDLITFYDRGIFYLEIMAERNNCKEMLPEKYFSFINENRYDDPIFIVHPILGIEIKPLEGDSKTRVFTDDERIEQDKKIVALYKRHRYRVIEIPSPDSPDLIRNFEVVNNSVNDRLSIIKKRIRLMKTPQLWVTIDKRGFSKEGLKKLLEYNIAGIRMNTGRCPYTWIYEVLEELSRLNYPLSQILLDIGNTKPRLHLTETNGMELDNGSLFSISDQAKDGVNAILPHKRFFEEVNLNDIVYFGDGEIEAVVEGVHQNTVTLRSLSGGRLGNHVAIGIKGKEFFKFLIDEKEIAEVNSVLHRFPISLILSFIESGDNLVWAKKVFPHAASVIPKIETGTAVSNIESILAQSDTIFVGRGDLGLSLGIEKIGIIQKEIIQKAQKAGCKISIGTGTLDSLKWSQIPLRAEIIDITNSCLEGIDYIALTSETAASQHPFKVLDFIQHILNYIKGID